MTGWGIDGVLYTFEVVPPEAIRFMLSPSDDGYHEPSNIREVNRTNARSRSHRSRLSGHSLRATRSISSLLFQTLSLPLFLQALF